MHLHLNFIFKSEFLKLLENSLIMPKELKNLQRNFKTRKFNSQRLHLIELRFSKNAPHPFIQIIFQTLVNHFI